LHRFVSYARGPFKQAQFAGPDKQFEYTVLDALETQVIVGVLHHNQSNVYVSGRDGTTFR